MTVKALGISSAHNFIEIKSRPSSGDQWQQSIRMSQVPKRNLSWLVVVLGAVVIAILALIAVPSFVREPRTSLENACINNLREIDGAKERWVLEHHAKTNDVVTLNDIKPYLTPYGEPNGFIKLDAKGNLPRCPAGGVYTIGKIGESPTCSVGPPSHVLP